MTNRIDFRGKKVLLGEDPKRGVCNICRYVVGEVHPTSGKVYKRTHMHHEAYNENKPTDHTIETCPYCHIMLRWEGYESKNKDMRFMRLNPDVHKALGELVVYKGETYSDIIMRLIKFYKEHRKQQRT